MYSIKKGDIEISFVVKLLIGLIVLLVVALIIWKEKDKALDLVTFFKNTLRFS